MSQHIDQIEIQKNISKIYMFNFFWMFLVIIPVFIPYLERFNLTMREIFLLQGLFGATIAICEVPSGYMSDLWGRKKTVVLGSFMSAVAFTIFTFADDFTGFLIFEVFCGIGMSLVSGSDFSILYDSIDAIGGSRSDKTRAVANIQFARVGSETVGSIVGGVLVFWSLRYAVWVQMVFPWVAFVIALTITEPPIQRMHAHRHWDNFKTVLSHIFKTDRVIRLSFIGFIVWTLATYTAVWIFQKYWMLEGISISQFGFIWAGYTLSVALISKWAPKLEIIWGTTLVIALIAISPVLGYFGMAALSGWMGIVIGLSFQICRGFTQVIVQDAINARTPNQFRATMNSFASLFFRGSFFIVGPVIGWGIDRWNLKAMLIALGISYLILGTILAPALIRSIHSQSGERKDPS